MLGWWKQADYMYIHELEKWPNFSWDQECIYALLIQLRYQQGRLIGGLGSIGFHVRDEIVLQTLTDIEQFKCLIFSFF